VVERCSRDTQIIYHLRIDTALSTHVAISYHLLPHFARLNIANDLAVLLAAEIPLALFIAELDDDVEQGSIQTPYLDALRCACECYESAWMGVVIRCAVVSIRLLRLVGRAYHWLQRFIAFGQSACEV